MSPPYQGSESRFLQLPAEIRMMIYSYLFEVPDDESILISTMSEAEYLAMGSHRRTSFSYTPCALGPRIRETTYWHKKICGKACKPRRLASSQPPQRVRVRLRRPPSMAQQLSQTSQIIRHPRLPPWLKPRSGNCREPVQKPVCVCPSRMTHFHPAILSTCRQICAEATPCLYQQHTFEFGNQFEAATAFFQDRSPYSASAVQNISLRVNPTGLRWNVLVWDDLCEVLKSARVQRLELIVETTDKSHITPDETSTDGCRPLTESDVRLMFDLHHRTVDWISALSKVRGIKELKVLPHRPEKAPSSHYCVMEDDESGDDCMDRKIATCMSMRKSIQGGLARFLKKQLGIPS